MKFFFVGGSNLLDDQCALTFPSLVSEHFGAEYVNASGVSASCDRTMRKVFCEYNMNDYDFIFIDFTLKNRTEFYDEEKKKFVQMSVYKIGIEKLADMYYSYFYNDTHGDYRERLAYDSITKYLDAIGKPYLTMTCNKRSKIKHDYCLTNYSLKSDNAHFNQEGHIEIAKDIISRVSDWFTPVSR